MDWKGILSVASTVFFKKTRNQLEINTVSKNIQKMCNISNNIYIYRKFLCHRLFSALLGLKWLVESFFEATKTGRTDAKPSEAEPPRGLLWALAACLGRNPYPIVCAAWRIKTHWKGRPFFCAVFFSKQLLP